MDFDKILNRLDRIEAALELLLNQRASKDWYTTVEVAELVNRSDYTVREWCRKHQVDAMKAPNGRGWLISHQELMRIRNNERPVAEQRTQRGFQSVGPKM
jgi:excisionase family DNA binding protein